MNALSDTPMTVLRPFKLLVLISFIILAMASCLPTDICTGRCMNGDPECITALALDGLEPPPDDDPDKQGLCAGVCSVLRAAQTDAEAEWAELGLEGEPPVHPCLRPE